MTVSSRLEGLHAEAIDRLSSRWDDAGLWADVTWLADRFWAAAPAERTLCWHHLVLAVGNFKRQPGRRLRPRLHPDPDDRLAPGAPGRARSSFEVPGTEPAVVVTVEDPGSWRRLEVALPGAAVATTTTLLAALWPAEHFVFDWRVAAAANALRIHANELPAEGIDPHNSVSEPITFDDYDTVRSWVLATAEAANRPVVAVERALYQLSSAVDGAAGRTWAAYAAELASRLHSG